MIFFSELKQVADNKFLPTQTHYQPFHLTNGLGKTKEELEQVGILLENIPEPENREGYSPILYLDAENNPFYEYNKIEIGELPQDEKINAVINKLITLEKENAELWYAIMMGV